MLEDVYTTPSARGRGLATAVIAAVLHAARAERHELVFVPTDAVGKARAALRAPRLRAAHDPAAADQRPAVSAAAERAIAWRHGYHAAVCSRIEPWAHGTIARAPDVPSYYDYNLARVEGARTHPASPTAEALAAAAEPCLAGLDHRRIEVEDEAAGARAGARLRRDGLGRGAAGVPAPRAARSGPQRRPRRRAASRGLRGLAAAARGLAGRVDLGRPAWLRADRGAGRRAARHPRGRRLPGRRAGGLRRVLGPRRRRRGRAGVLPARAPQRRPRRRAGRDGARGPRTPRARGTR